ncbi:MAG TPA: hypothetical protein VJ941_12490 [Gracilimonas sp.]|nr:hypothetical protein [Gracilimonas sp.]
MDNIPRFAFYASGVFMTSAAFTLLSSEFLVKITDPSYVGILFLFGFGLVYMNILFVTGRRFMRRLQGASPVPYIFGLLVAIPPLLWVQIYEAGLGNARLTFQFVVIVACGLGALFGHRAGLKAQVQFQKDLQEYLKKERNLHNNSKNE